MKFRYDINALRAIAVIFVVFFHYKVPFFDGGFAGVDMFFVISGYLMSKIILNGFDTSSFSLMGFYKKRFVRIVPALLVLILVIQLIGSFILCPNEQKLLSKYALSSEFFYSNIYYFLKTGYFDAAAENNPLLHTWSLSVEWQFYLIYPILLLPFRKIYLNKREVFNKIVIASLIACFIITMFIAGYKNSLAFYSFPTRAWEMLIGCFIVLNEKKMVDALSLKVRNAIVLISVLVILIFISTFSAGHDWPGLYTLIPVLGTAVIVMCNSSFMIMKNPVVQFLGKISYSLYLWHWPLYVFLVSFDLESVFSILLLSAIVLLLSYASYKYIESNKNIFSSLKARILYPGMIICFSIVMHNIHINEYIVDERIIKMANYGEEHKNESKKQFSTGKCFLYSNSRNEDFSYQECLELSDSIENVLLFGDSHAAEFSLSLKEKLGTLNMNLLQATTSHCFPLLNTKGRKENAKLVEYILTEFIPENESKIGLVIISANWKECYGYSKEDIKFKLNELIDYLNQRNINVKIIGQTENYSNPFPSIYAKHMVFPSIRTDKFITDDSNNFNEFLKSFITDDVYIDVFNILDKKMSTSYCPYMLDNNHLSKWATDQYVDILINKGLLDEVNYCCVNE